MHQPRRGPVPTYTPPGMPAWSSARPDRIVFLPTAPPSPEPPEFTSEDPPTEEGPTSPVVRSAPKKARSTSPRRKRATTGTPGASSAPPFHERFSEWLELGGFTRAEAARKLGLPRERVSEWANGRVVPGAASLVRLAEVLGLDLNALKSRIS